MIGGDDRPAVGQAADAGLAGVDHRLDGEDHSGLQLEAGTGPAVMQHLRVLMELGADTVATEFAHHRETMSFGEFLDRGADVAQVPAGRTA